MLGWVPCFFVILFHSFPSFFSQKLKVFLLEFSVMITLHVWISELIVSYTSHSSWYLICVVLYELGTNCDTNSFCWHYRSRKASCCYSLRVHLAFLYITSFQMNVEFNLNFYSWSLIDVWNSSFSVVFFIWCSSIIRFAEQSMDPEMRATVFSPRLMEVTHQYDLLSLAS